MFGLAVLGIVGLYLFLQFVIAPLFGYWLGRKLGWRGKKAALAAFAGFLLVFVPVWHKQLPAIIVFQYMKRDAGAIIYKPFEQWVKENPGVLETLKRNKDIIKMKKSMGDGYPNRILYYNQYRLGISSELCVNGKQRIGWYTGGKTYINAYVSKWIDILYDIERKEILATDVSIGIRVFGFLNYSWYRGYPSKEGYDLQQYYSKLTINGEM